MQNRSWLALPLLLAAAGCGGTSSEDFGAGRGGTDGGGGGTGGSLFDSGSGGSDAETDDCAASARLVYVITEQNQLFSLDPGKLPATSAFNPVGTVSCPAGGATPFSMAVQRNGTAWVVFNDGSLWNVSTLDASCKAVPGYQPGQNGFNTFGMGFVSDAAGGGAETLYLARSSGGTGGGGNGKLGKLDLSTLQITPVGNMSGDAELTGTGDGRLFAFFQSGSSAAVAELDKSTGATLSTAPQNGLVISGGWAFAFWGGSFWMFTGLQASVTQYDPVAKKTMPVVGGLPGTIVGAGVSTCAPITPPA